MTAGIGMTGAALSAAGNAPPYGTYSVIVSAFSSGDFSLATVGPNEKGTCISPGGSAGTASDTPYSGLGAEMDSFLAMVAGSGTLELMTSGTGC